MTKSFKILCATLCLSFSVAFAQTADPALSARLAKRLGEFLITYVNTADLQKLLAVNPNTEMYHTDRMLFTDQGGSAPAVLMLGAFDAKGNTLGTCVATLIGPKHVVTAKQCMMNMAATSYAVFSDAYLKGNFGELESAKVVKVYENCAAPGSGWCKANESSLNISYIAAEFKLDEKVSQDAVVLELDRDLGIHFGYFELHDSAISLEGIKLHISGYPAFAAGLVGGHPKYITSPICDFVNQGPGFVITNCIVTGGLLGGPLFYVKDQKWILVGVLSSSIGPLPGKDVVYSGSIFYSAFTSDLVRRFTAPPLLLETK